MTEPCTIIDKDYRIKLWYLPDLILPENLVSTRNNSVLNVDLISSK